MKESRLFKMDETLRKRSGVQASSEEGFGLRPHIGIRGLHPLRSTRVRLLNATTGYGTTGLRAFIEAMHTGRQFGDDLSTANSTVDGQRGAVPGFVIFNATFLSLSPQHAPPGPGRNSVQLLIGPIGYNPHHAQADFTHSCSLRWP